ncbi:LemA family protein [Candidatus Micrarchaeota archaeon]|nr:LemA family protein [Candidatus Micrarchaeota archaeon]
MTLELIAIGIGVVVLLWLALTYNSFVTLRNRIDNAWSQIDVQLKKRYDLIPNLVETVKGYARYEKSVFENVTKARSAMMTAGNVADKAKADNMLTGALKSLFAVAENYPNLKANENFKQLQEELSGIESKIAYARQFFNDSVLEYNTKTQTVPSSIIAGMLGFHKKDYFQAEGNERAPVKVSFDKL